ncbi:MAG: oligopeptide/dipeptide transporter, ATPase subunit [Clostridia bacterium]|jgi:peptide/nickel transport system ATP-binding protein/oligopeptide transport system ATP-binding protein|nr:oligopeptide/dipeptide transporter, ATPase subunit [Clostridia bacterium]
MNKIIEVKDLTKHFKVASKLGTKVEYVKAVNGVSFDILEGQTLGLVGESGCGKSTTGRLILRLIKPTSGDLFLEGKNINQISDKELRSIRKDIQVVFQNPYSALDPKMTIADILSEPLSIHKVVHKYQYEKEVKRLIHLVGLSERDLRKFPHEFSGGQRQRIGIARAIATKPKFIICDEPVSALDVSVQSQILNLLTDLQSELKVSYLFIAHGLNVIRHMSKKVGVMYLGKIVEIGDVEDIYSNPQHPYTKILLSSAPIADPFNDRDRQFVKGEVPSPINTPSGCAYHPRCEQAMEICKIKTPFLKSKDREHKVACHLLDFNEMIRG